MHHVPVLLDDVSNHLDVGSDKDYIDTTIGGGGYTKALLELNSPCGRVLAIDWDEDAIKRLKREFFGEGDEVRSKKPEPHPCPTGRRGSDPAPFSERLTLVRGNFRDIKTIALSNGFDGVAGVVFDLGLSSELIEVSGRGFSYLRDEPLLMTFSKSQALKGGLTARKIVNTYSTEDLFRIFHDYGEERQSRKISRIISESRRQKPIKTSGDLIKAIETVTASVKTKARIFQALRIETNDELGNLAEGLSGAWAIMETGARLVVVSFHSLEDRLVKRFFQTRQEKKEGYIITKKPKTPDAKEIKVNPRARSAKLRAIKKI